MGPRFPDMSEVYSRRLRALADDAGRAAGVAVRHGVYVAVHGPSYETPAEIRAFRALGADAVGMSTVPEAIAARHMGVEVLGISCITNMAAGVLRSAAGPRRGDGDRAPRARLVHRAAGGRHWAPLQAPPSAAVLVQAARRARRNAHADYSHFKVGAALETADGTIVTGCNIENATYGLTVCAERVAMWKALSEGHRKFRRIAVVADTAIRRRRAARAARFCGSSAATSR